jgi:hypothetical protein
MKIVLLTGDCNQFRNQDNSEFDYVIMKPVDNKHLVDILRKSNII